MIHVQSLESRTLLSSSLPAAIFSDVLQLRTDVAAARADMRGQAPALRADVAGLRVSLHSVPVTTQNRALVATLRRDELNSVATLEADLLRVQRGGGATVARAIAGGKAVLRHPTNTAAQARLSAALGEVVTFAGITAAKFQNDAQICETSLSADLMALASANPTNASLQAAVSTTGGGVAAFLTAAGSQLPAVQADLGKLLADFATVT